MPTQTCTEQPPPVTSYPATSSWTHMKRSSGVPAKGQGSWYRFSMFVQTRKLVVLFWKLTDHRNQICAFYVYMNVHEFSIYSIRYTLMKHPDTSSRSFSPHQNVWNMKTSKNLPKTVQNSHSTCFTSSIHWLFWYPSFTTSCRAVFTCFLHPWFHPNGWKVCSGVWAIQNWLHWQSRRSSCVKIAR